MEVTSKKPVTRNRTVVEVPKIVSAKCPGLILSSQCPQVPRDPRFLPLAGEFKAEAFQKSYAFLAESHKTELQTLKDNLKRANRLLSSSPRDQLEERQAEVERLERAVKRTESLVNRDRQDAIQQDALSRVKAQEKAKRADGKGAWHMKKGKSLSMCRCSDVLTVCVQARNVRSSRKLDSRQLLLPVVAVPLRRRSTRSKRKSAKRKRNLDRTPKAHSTKRLLLLETVLQVKAVRRKGSEHRSSKNIHDLIGWIIVRT